MPNTTYALPYGWEIADTDADGLPIAVEDRWTLTTYVVEWSGHDWMITDVRDGVSLAASQLMVACDRIADRTARIYGH